MIVNRSLEQLTRDYILQILEHCEYNREEAAKILDIKEDVLKSKIKDYTFFKPLAMLRYDPIALPQKEQIIYREKIVEKIVEVPGPTKYIHVNTPIQETKEENDLVNEYANLLFDFRSLENKYNELKERQ